MPIVLLSLKKKNDIKGRKIVASHRDLVFGSAHLIYEFVKQSFQS